MSVPQTICIVTGVIFNLGLEVGDHSSLGGGEDQYRYPEGVGMYFFQVKDQGRDINQTRTKREIGRSMKTESSTMIAVGIRVEI